MVIWAVVECKSTYMWYYYVVGREGWILFFLASTQQLLFWQVLHVCTYPRAFWESNWTIAHRKYGVSPPPSPSSSWTMEMWWGLFSKISQIIGQFVADGPNKLWGIFCWYLSTHFVIAHCCIKGPQNLHVISLLKTYTGITCRIYNKILWRSNWPLNKR